MFFKRAIWRLLINYEVSIYYTKTKLNETKRSCAYITFDDNNVISLSLFIFNYFVRKYDHTFTISHVRFQMKPQF